MSRGGSTFPLVSRRRLHGLAFGSMRGVRRGTGSDVAGSRPYVLGDDPDHIDWAASARLSAALDDDRFVVREHYADEAPRVILVTDTRAAMATPPWVPWLRKDVALAECLQILEQSVVEARGVLGRLELTDDPNTVRWAPPGAGVRNRALVDAAFPDGGRLESVFAFLALHRRAAPSGSFVFVLSDFLEPVALDDWERAVDRGWDVVPVVIQDPVWDRGFPDVDGIVVPLVAPDGRRRLVRLGRGESGRRRRAHEERRQELLEGLGSLGIGTVLVESEDPEEVLEAFVAWSVDRQASLGAVA